MTEQTSVESPQKKSILLIEDEDVNRDLYKKLLEMEGYQVDTAVNGTQAYEKMRKGGYDLVLLDIIMPEKNGVEVLEKLKQESTSAQPMQTIVFLTNLTQEEIIAKGVELGARGYLVKSDYDPEEFLQQIQEFLK